MLEIRPTCEHCNKALPANATDAMICSFECTFCSACVHDVLENVCPTCGGGFCARPVRPATIWNNGLSLAKYPAGARIVHKPVDLDKQRALIATLQGLPAEQR